MHGETWPAGIVDTNECATREATAGWRRRPSHRPCPAGRQATTAMLLTPQEIKLNTNTNRTRSPLTVLQDAWRHSLRTPPRLSARRAPPPSRRQRRRRMHRHRPGSRHAEPIPQLHRRRRLCRRANKRYGGHARFPRDRSSEKKTNTSTNHRPRPLPNST